MRTAATALALMAMVSACAPAPRLPDPADSGLEVPAPVQQEQVPDAQESGDPDFLSGEARVRALAAVAAISSGNAIRAQLSGHVLPDEMADGAIILLEDLLGPLLY